MEIKSETVSRKVSEQELRGELTDLGFTISHSHETDTLVGAWSKELVGGTFGASAAEATYQKETGWLRVLQHAPAHKFA